MKPLDFANLRAANVKRCNRSFHHVFNWTPCDWACALAGEVGEACNLIKKDLRGDGIEISAIAKELADVVCYADLLAARLHIDLGEAVRAKFNEVSDRKGSDIRL